MQRWSMCERWRGGNDTADSRSCHSRGLFDMAWNEMVTLFRRYHVFVRFEDMSETVYPVYADSFETARAVARLLAADRSQVNPIARVQVMLKAWDSLAEV